MRSPNESTQRDHGDRTFDTTLLTLRLLNGVLFVAHGWAKLGDLRGFSEWLGQIGVPWPGLVSPMVACVELVGGVLLLLGVFSRLAALGHAVIMMVAIGLVHQPWVHGLTGHEGMEFPLTLLVTSGIIVFEGGGRYSLRHTLQSLRARGDRAQGGGHRWSQRAGAWFGWFATAMLLAAATSCDPDGDRSETRREDGAAGEVIEAESELWRRFQESDIEQMMAMLDDDFTAFSGSYPFRMDSAEAEEAHLRDFVQSLDGQVLDWKMLDPRVQVLGDAGVLTYLFSTEVSIRGQKQHRTGKNTAVWVRRPDGWKQAHYQYCFNPLDV